MPVSGRSLGHAARAYADQLNGLLNRTITRSRLSVQISQPVEHAFVRYRSGGHDFGTSIRTRYGPMRLYISYTFDSHVGEDGLHTLETESYRLALEPVAAAQPLIRWEYVRPTADDDLWCRYHVQGPISVGITARDGTPANMNDWHLPTGWVPIEEVLRFCIVDLGVLPLRDDWHATLRDSQVGFATFGFER